MGGIKKGREKEKVSCRREGVVDHGWGLLIGSRELSRVVFCCLLIETDIHFGGVFFCLQWKHNTWDRRIMSG